MIGWIIGGIWVAILVVFVCSVCFERSVGAGRKYVVVKRNYHGAEHVDLVRWVVVCDGNLRGVCECWDERNAREIANALNARPEVVK